MSNRYHLTIAAMNQRPKLEIDKARYDRLKTSRLILSHALAIEEKYEILISNFLELECYAINATVFEMIRNRSGYKNSFDVRLALNIRLVNLLTSARLYIDQLSSHICACVNSRDETKDDIKKLFAAEYDSSFEYRFMEALRNYVQHCGIPVHKVTSSGKLIDKDKGLLEFSIYFGTRKEELLLDNAFKKQVLNEMPEEVNLQLASRNYVESISRIHKHARDKIDNIVEFSRLETEKAIRDYTVVYEREPLGLFAYEYKGKQKVDEVVIILKWDEVRQELVKRNSELVNLRKRYVTNITYNK